MTALYGIGSVVALIVAQFVILAVALYRRDGFTPWDRRFWQ